MSDNLITVTADLQKQIGLKFTEVGEIYEQIADIKKKYAHKSDRQVISTPKSKNNKYYLMILITIPIIFILFIYLNLLLKK